ncbi:MurR/RpiR family transcriptional regulator [Bacillus aquiflavi]|uniref:MurR/RpiR family transcriptional regulator n=1 Tax=Bacillus aquiflavi TaxID=2672567 RepID=A0A6B3W359_9BACI|nr:MurR/RpiR family transcriptional regulator [Bacillus aquiflavi]MBA4538564.1 MurR/RpiR family transcriptional regulator [Bacillus aquiflavi]NEY82927.1 MurR/RpiR family transcriptional regulator [Bacillus aquiflavi]
MVEVYKLIANKLPEMSKSQRKIAKYVLSNTESVPFFTVGKLAKMAGVSEATVVRFATFLGFSGYSKWQKAMQESVKRQLTTVERLQLSDDVYEKEDKAIYEMFHEEIERIQTMADQFNAAAFDEAVQSIIKAERIFIIANRSAVSLGAFLEFYFDLMFQNTELIRNPHGISEKLFRLNKNDVVIGLSFARYTQNTIEAVSFAKDRGTKVIAITDHLLSPLIPFADVALTAPSEMPSFIDSFVAPLSLINALITAVGRKKRTEIEQHLENLEEVWERFHIFFTHK